MCPAEDAEMPCVHGRLDSPRSIPADVLFTFRIAINAADTAYVPSTLLIDSATFKPKLVGE